MKKLYILGSGCPKCNTLFELTEQAAKDLGIEYTIEKISDINKIMQYGVMITPALVVDDEIKVAGKIPTVKELQSILKD